MVFSKTTRLKIQPQSSAQCTDSICCISPSVFLINENVQNLHLPLLVSWKHQRAGNDDDALIK